MSAWWQLSFLTSDSLFKILMCLEFEKQMQPEHVGCLKKNAAWTVVPCVELACRVNQLGYMKKSSGSLEIFLEVSQLGYPEHSIIRVNQLTWWTRHPQSVQIQCVAIWRKPAWETEGKLVLISCLMLFSVPFTILKFNSALLQPQSGFFISLSVLCTIPVTRQKQIR